VRRQVEWKARIAQPSLDHARHVVGRHPGHRQLLGAASRGSEQRTRLFGVIHAGRANVVQQNVEVLSSSLCILGCVATGRSARLRALVAPPALHETD
jgi:hypothetical protein